MSEIIITKCCLTCKKIKSSEEFHKDKSTNDGLHRWCKICRSIQMRNYYQTENGCRKIRNWAKKYYKSGNGKIVQKKWQLQNKQAIKLYDKQYSLKHPERIQAKNAVNHKIEKGQILPVKNYKCNCGENAQHYHHYKGYAKENWFDIIPICVPCHKYLHN